jgi:hypothetical protein
LPGIIVIATARTEKKTPMTDTSETNAASMPISYASMASSGPNSASLEDDPVRAKTPPHPQNPAVVDRLLAKR